MTNNWKIFSIIKKTTCICNVNFLYAYLQCFSWISCSAKLKVCFTWNPPSTFTFIQVRYKSVISFHFQCSLKLYFFKNIFFLKFTIIKWIKVDLLQLPCRFQGCLLSGKGKNKLQSVFWKYWTLSSFFKN